MKSGRRLGCVSDVEINTCSGEVLAIIIYGRNKFFGLFGRCEDVYIKWCDIQVIGEDTILVCHERPPEHEKKEKKKGFWNQIFGYD